MLRKLVLVPLLAGIAPGAFASVTELPRTDDDIKIDGVLDETVWQLAARVDLAWEIEPGENLEAPVATRAFLVEDGQNLYVAFEADDPDPDSIRAYLRDRDSAWNDDHVGIMLDTYNDERRAFEFYVNALGVQMDKILDDTRGGGGGGGNNAAWDAIWDSAGKITDTGYVVEMRIPLSQLRFPDVEGTKTWGFGVRRVYPRTRHHRLSNNKRDRSRNCALCQIEKLEGLEASRPSRDIEVVPTVTASFNSTTDDPGFIPLESSDPDIEAGLTMRWGISPDLTANFTINPDFSQIEADVAQLEVNNRFAVFYREKRPFFLEGAEYFDTPIDAVFTRTITAPEFGAKLTGKRGNHTFGVIAAQDEVTNLLFPGLYGSDTESLEQSNTAFVGRYSRGFADASSVGVIATLREGDNYHNYVGGIDGRWRINDQHSIEFHHLESTTEYPLGIATEFDQPIEEFDGRATEFEYDYDSRNWSAELEFADFTEGFRADSGLVNQVGGRSFGGRIGRVFYGGVDDWWTRVRANIHYTALYDEDGNIAERRTFFRLGGGGPLQSWLQLNLQDLEVRHEDVLYDLNRVSLYGEFVPRSGLFLMLLGSFGDSVDYSNDRPADSVFLETQINWNIGRKFLTRLRGTSSSLETESGEQIFDAMLVDARLTWQFSRRSFLRFTIQHRDVERNLAVYVDDDVDARSKSVGKQLLYSYKVNPQTVFFVGYTDSYVDDDDIDGLTAEDRTWFMKIGYAWTP